MISLSYIPSLLLVIILVFVFLIASFPCFESLFLKSKDLGRNIGLFDRTKYRDKFLFYKVKNVNRKIISRQVIFFSLRQFHCVTLDDLELTEIHPPASASSVLGLKAYSTMLQVLLVIYIITMTASLVGRNWEVYIFSISSLNLFVCFTEGRLFCVCFKHKLVCFCISNLLT